jgi:hypothetical protein
MMTSAPALLQFAVKRIDIIDPQMRVECFGLVAAVRAAAAAFSEREYDDLVVAPDHREDRRVLEEIADDPETELVAIVLGCPGDIGKPGAVSLPHREMSAETTAQLDRNGGIDWWRRDGHSVTVSHEPGSLLAAE